MDPTAAGASAPPPYVIYGTDRQLVQLNLRPGQVLHSASPAFFLWSSSGVALEQRPRAGISWSVIWFGG